MGLKGDFGFFWFINLIAGESVEVKKFKMADESPALFLHAAPNLFATIAMADELIFAETVLKKIQKGELNTYQA